MGANLNIELNNMEVLSDAVDSMIEKLDRQSPVLYWLLEYIEERIADDKRWNVSGEIKNFGRNIFDEGYIEKGKEAQIKEKYFNSDIEYESLTTVVEGDEYQFIVIPKSLDATLRIWKYNVSENGELYSEGLLLEAVGTPLLIKTQCTEVFPRVGVEYEFGDTKFTIPLMISGMDGKFTITDYKNLVKDISIY